MARMGRPNGCSAPANISMRTSAHFNQPPTSWRASVAGAMFVHVPSLPPVLFVAVKRSGGGKNKEVEEREEEEAGAFEGKNLLLDRHCRMCAKYFGRASTRPCGYELSSSLLNFDGATDQS